MFCSNCGSTVVEGHAFCVKCGNKVLRANAPSQSVAAVSRVTQDDRVGTAKTPIPLGMQHLNFAQAAKWVGAILAISIIGAAAVVYVQDHSASPASNAASEIIKKTLRSPSSFELVSERQVWTGKASDGKDAYIYHVEYDAQNGFGATVRGSTYVGYEMSGDQYEWKPGMALDSSPESMESAVVEEIRQLNFEK